MLCFAPVSFLSRLITPTLSKPNTWTRKDLKCSKRSPTLPAAARADLPSSRGWIEALGGQDSRLPPSSVDTIQYASHQLLTRGKTNLQVDSCLCPLTLSHLSIRLLARPPVPGCVSPVNSKVLWQRPTTDRLQASRFEICGSPWRKILIRPVAGA